MSNANPPQNKLHEVLIALQKSLSRVSRDSVRTEKEQALALINGDVNFSFTLKCDLAADDLLVINKTGDIELQMSGIITTDLEVKDNL